jgi:hypothetical protein
MRCKNIYANIMDNITFTTDETAPSSPPSIELANVEITDYTVALNVMIGFLNIAQNRGAFTINESSKIWECIQKFLKIS